MKKVILLILLALLGIGGWWAYDHCYDIFHPGYHSEIYTPEKYLKLKDSLRVQRESLQASYNSSAAQNKPALIGKARKEFTAAVKDELFPFWVGTDWAYSGTTEVPGEGSIACGYFVTTVLRDAGVRIERNKLAQCASEEMIKTLADPKCIRRFSNIGIAEFEKAVQEWGDGVYVVGLDNHTGFIICSNKEVSFVHSGGGVPMRVIVQKPADARLLAKSRYRVLARLTESESFLKKWITGEKFK